MTDDDGTKTAIALLGGRNIVIKLPTDSQIGLLAQQARIAGGNDSTKKIRAVGIIMDVMHNLIAETDRDYVVDLMIAGSISISDVMGLFDAFKEEKAVAKPAAVRRAARR